MTRARPGGALEAAPLDAKGAAQRVADLLAAALHTDVEVVDRDLVRLAAAEMRPGFAHTPTRPGLYLTAMRTRLPAWADETDPDDGPVAAFPIIAAGDVAGAIGLRSVLTEQGGALRAQRRKVSDLVAAVAEPLRNAGEWATAAPAGERSGGTPAAVLESLPDGVLAVDAAGIVLYCNRAALQMLRAEMDLTGQFLTHWYSPGAEDMTAAAGLRAREVVFDRYGQRFRFLEARAPLRAGAQITGTVIVLRAAGIGASPLYPSVPTLLEAERQLISDALARHGTTGAGKRRAARALGISLSTLYRKLRKPSPRPRRR